MKKIFLVLGFSLLLAGCQKVSDNNSTSIQPTEPPKNIFTSIADAVQKQMVLKCEYVDEDGKTTTTYIKGGTVRMIGQGDDNKKIDGLMKDEKFYLWSGGNKQGVVFDISKMEGASMGKTPVNSVDDVIGVLESQKDRCTVSPESSGLLDLPTDVIFTDTGNIFSGTGN